MATCVVSIVTRLFIVLTNVRYSCLSILIELLLNLARIDIFFSIMTNLLAILVDMEKYFSCFFLLYYMVVLANMDTCVTFCLAKP
jgi:hypothetical protein